MSYASSSGRSLYRQYSSTGTTSSENLPPRTLARVARELRNLHKNPPDGVRMIIDGENSSSSGVSDSSMASSSLSSVASAAAITSNLEQVLCEMQGPTETPYEGRFFVLKLVFTSDFPLAPPRGFFVTKLYHPNVDPHTGAICVNTLKKDWTAETTLSHVLAVIRCLLIVPFPESSLNDEAGKLFMESYQEYAKRAKLMAQVHGRAYNILGNQVCDEQQQDKSMEEPLSTVDHNNSVHANGGDDLVQRGALSKATTLSSSPSSKSSGSGINGNSSTTGAAAASPLRSNGNNNNKKITTTTKLAGGAKVNKKKSLKRL